MHGIRRNLGSVGYRNAMHLLQLRSMRFIQCDSLKKQSGRLPVSDQFIVCIEMAMACNMHSHMHCTFKDCIHGMAMVLSACRRALIHNSRQEHCYSNVCQS